MTLVYSFCSSTTFFQTGAVFFNLGNVPDQVIDLELIQLLLVLVGQLHLGLEPPLLPDGHTQPTGR